MKKISTVVMLGLLTGVCAPVQGALYGGKLRCATLNHLMGSQPALEVGRFCRAALDKCGLMEMIKSHEKVPFVAESKDELEQLMKNELTICELAILNHDPDFYAESLKR
jgi:hypothetical protein